MNKTDLASSVATRTSITKATADSAVAAVFATIAEALTRGEKVSIAGFGTFATRSRPVRQGRNPRDRGEHRHRRLHGAVVQGRQDAPRCRQPAITVKPPDGRSARDRSVHPEPPLLSRPMFVAERRWRNFGDPTHVRTPAQSRARIESSLARGPYTAGCEFSPATAVRMGALKSKSKRSRLAYCTGIPPAPRPPSPENHGTTVAQLRTIESTAQAPLLPVPTRPPTSPAYLTVRL